MSGKWLAVSRKRLLAAGGGLLIAFSQLLSGHGQELTANYSFVAYNPARGVAGGRNLNGGGGSIGLTFGNHVTLKGEFQGYGTTTLTYHLAQTDHSAGGQYQSQGTMLTYLFGPQFAFPFAGKRVFCEALFGGAHTDAYANLFRAARVTGLSASNNGFAMALGGGLDFQLSPHLGFRPAQVDYLMTRYEWKPLGINNQSNFRYQAGFLFLFGRQ